MSRFSTLLVTIDGEELDATLVGDVTLKLVHTIYHTTMVKITFLCYDELVEKINSWASRCPHLQGTVQWVIRAPQEVSRSVPFRFNLSGIALGLVGPTCKVTIMGVSFLRDMQMTCSQGTFRNATISQCIEALAGRYVITEIAPSVDKYTLHQCNRTDYDFLCNELIPRLSYEGDKRIIAYDDGDGKFVVTQLSKIPDSGITVTTQYNQGDGDYIGYSEADSTMTTTHEDFGVVAQIQDITKQQQTFDNGLYQFYHDITYPVQYIDKGAPEKAGWQDKPYYGSVIQQVLTDDVVAGSELTAELDKRREWGPGSGLVRTRVVTTLDTKLTVGTRVTLDMRTGSGIELFPAGKCLVYGLEHNLDATGEFTVIYLERRGL